MSLSRISDPQLRTGRTTPPYEPLIHSCLHTGRTTPPYEPLIHSCVRAALHLHMSLSRISDPQLRTGRTTPPYEPLIHSCLRTGRTTPPYEPLIHSCVRAALHLHMSLSRISDPQLRTGRTTPPYEPDLGITGFLSDMFSDSRSLPPSTGDTRSYANDRRTCFTFTFHGLSSYTLLF
ncbi:unnamed protein product [Leuciscus chuanchicus]